MRAQRLTTGHASSCSQEAAAAGASGGDPGVICGASAPRMTPSCASCVACVQPLLQAGDGAQLDRPAERRQELAGQRAHHGELPRRHDPHGALWPRAAAAAAAAGERPGALQNVCSGAPCRDPPTRLSCFDACAAAPACVCRRPPQVGFNMKKVTKGGVTIKMWDLGGQVRSTTTQPSQRRGRAPGCSASTPHLPLCARLRRATAAAVPQPLGALLPGGAGDRVRGGLCGPRPHRGVCEHMPGGGGARGPPRTVLRAQLSLPVAPGAAHWQPLVAQAVLTTAGRACVCAHACTALACSGGAQRAACVAGQAVSARHPPAGAGQQERPGGRAHHAAAH